MSVQPALERELRAAPPVPRPAGVIDLGAYRGRTGAAPAVVPPPHPDADDALAAPVRVPGPGPAPTVTDVRPGPAVDGGEVVIRRVRLGSVLRMTFGLSLCGFVVVVGAGVLIWLTISTLGVVENLESLAEDLGWTDVAFDGPAMLRAACIGGGILVVAATFLSVVFTEVFNLLSTITGGLRADVGPPPVSRRQRRKARKAARRATKAGAS